MEMDEKLKQLAEAIERKEEIISVDNKTYDLIYRLKRLSSEKWKIIVPILVATIGAGAAALILDPFEGLEIAAFGTGVVTLSAILGPDVIPAIKLARFKNGKKILESIREEYYTSRISSNNLIHLIRRDPINVSQLEYPPIIYVSSKVKLPRYDDEKNIAFLTKEYAKEWKQLKSIELKGNSDFNYCKDGTIFIKHPFLPKTYMELKDALDTGDILREKIARTGTIINLLGAKLFSGEAIFIGQQTVEITNKSEIKYKFVEANANVKKQKTSSLNKKYMRESKGPGTYSEDDYNKAKELAAEYGLDSDTEIITLFETRAPTNSNKITSLKTTYELTKEINKTLDIAVGLQINGFNLGNDYKSKINKREVINYTLNIEF